MLWFEHEMSSIGSLLVTCYPIRWVLLGGHPILVLHLVPDPCTMVWTTFLTLHHENNFSHLCTAHTLSCSTCFSPPGWTKPPKTVNQVFPLWNYFCQILCSQEWDINQCQHAESNYQKEQKVTLITSLPIFAAPPSNASYSYSDLVVPQRPHNCEK